MERFLRPERFSCDPNSPDASDYWRHWFKTFNNFLSSFPEDTNFDKLNILVNFVDQSVYKYIVDCSTFDAAVNLLEGLYVKPKNEVFARHVLATTKQEAGQTLDEFLQKLKMLAKECNFVQVSADKNRDDFIRDAFICGLSSNQIRQRLLENKTLDLTTAFDQARSLEMAEKQSQTYTMPKISSSCGSAAVQPSTEELDSFASAAIDSKCYFCGYQRHPRSKCPAREAICKTCGKKGHFQKVCRSKGKPKQYISAADSVLSASFSAAAPSSLNRAVINIKINNNSLKALVDTGSSESFISANTVKQLKLASFKSEKEISMASTDLSTSTKGHCFTDFEYNGTDYQCVKLSILPKLCADLILGHDFLKQHDQLQITFEGPKPTFSICGVSAAKVEPVSLFKNLLPDCKPIATKSRRFSQPDKNFIQSEIQKLVAEDVIEASDSPWRAQVLVTSNDRHKKRLVVDYSQTINRFTLLDAYPLPRIDEMIEQISGYEFYSTLDLKSAYHQIPIVEDEKCYTAFEACGNLYQFKRVPFGVTNGVASFQRVIDGIIRDENIKDTFAYLDNVTICGNSKEEHDRNLDQFMKCAAKYKITFNEDKSILSTKQVKLLGYLVSKGSIQPDPDRLQPLRDMAPPHNMKSQQRAIGMFSYYSSWISHFSDKIHHLVANTTFPLPQDVQDSFNQLKKEVENATVVTIDEDVPLVVETDASDIAIAATLNQHGKPVAFFSRTLNHSERKHSSVEKEAYAIVEALRKWRHYLLGRHFKLVTDQKSVAFMYSSHKGKVKNDKIQRWKMELACYSYDTVYRPGPENSAADAFSRAYCSSSSAQQQSLPEIHNNLSHPGVTRMWHYIKSKKLPYSLDEVKEQCRRCKICCQLKPSFFKPTDSHLIKATQPFERLSLDFKGPLPSCGNSRNRYLLTAIDEYSRFPFAFPCADMNASTIIKCLCQLFALFGMPSFIHSDRGSNFMSNELKDFLHRRGIATSRTTPYNPQANGQVERLNGSLWKTITLNLKSRGLNSNQWELVLQDSLHSLRSLLCTATNETPHERIFRYNRKSATGTTLPSWLTTPGTVLMRRNVRNSKYDPLVDEVELLDCNPLYAHVRLQDGRETTVALRHLAPAGDISQGQTLNDESLHLPKECESEISPQEIDSDNSENLVTDQLMNNDVSESKNSDNTSISDSIQNNNGLNPQDFSQKSVEERSNPFIRTRPYNLRNREA